MTNYDRVKKYRKRKPWARPREYARRRCIDPKHREYDGYGGRGIQFKLTMSEAKILFIRDNGFHMEKPSLDRINPDGHYEFTNCRFIELVDNVARKRPPNSIPDLQPITEWDE